MSGDPAPWSMLTRDLDTWALSSYVASCPVVIRSAIQQGPESCRGFENRRADLFCGAPKFTPSNTPNATLPGSSAAIFWARLRVAPVYTVSTDQLQNWIPCRTLHSSMANPSAVRPFVFALESSTPVRIARAGSLSIAKLSLRMVRMRRARKRAQAEAGWGEGSSPQA